MAEQLVTVGLIHCLVLASPGPDFTLVLRAAAQSRATGLWAAAGIASGVTLHLTAVLAGMGLLLQSCPVAITGVRWLGAGYLAWIGIGALRQSLRPAAADSPGPSLGTGTRALVTGAITNATNPKALLYFTSLGTQVLTPESTLPFRLALGAELVLVTLAWFGILATLLSAGPARRWLTHSRRWVDAVTGIAFVGFASRLLTTH